MIKTFHSIWTKGFLHFILIIFTLVFFYPANGAHAEISGLLVSASGLSTNAISGNQLYSLVGQPSPLGFINDSSIIDNQLVSGYQIPKNLIYTINFSAVPLGQITGLPQQRILYDGNCQAVTAVPNDNHHFIGWSGDYVGEANPLLISNITRDLNITANFAIDMHTVTFLADDNGSLDGLTVQTVPYGSDCLKVTAIPDLNYYFAGWSGDYPGADNPFILQNVWDDLTITANFSLYTHTLTMAQSGTGNGTVNPDFGQSTYGRGTTVTLTATALGDTSFAGWSGAVVGIENPTTIVMDSDKTVFAHFVAEDEEGTAATLKDAPSGITGSKEYTVTVGGIGVVSYEWKVDDSSWSAEMLVEDPFTFSITEEKEYTLYVIGKDFSENWQQEEEATISTWTVDVTPPFVEISNYPPPVTSINSINITVSGPDVQFYKFQLDDCQWSDSLSKTISIDEQDLAEGDHTLKVIGMDMAGNWLAEQNPFSFTWNISADLPTAVLSDLPDLITKKTSARIIVGGELTDAYKYKVDAGDWIYNSSDETIELKNLAQGFHSLYVNAYNESSDLWQDQNQGTILTKATTYEWLVDMTPPEAPHLRADQGAPASTAIDLSWTATENGLKRYRLYYTKSNEETIESATELYCAIVPGPAGYNEKFTISGLSRNTTYYFTVTFMDRAGNESEVSNIASYTTLNTLPAITDIALIAGGNSGDNSMAREFRVEGSNFVGSVGDNLIRFISDASVFDIVNKAGTREQIWADIPPGAPVGTYHLRVINKHGVSALSEDFYQVNESPAPYPEVINIFPPIGPGNENTEVTILGAHFIGYLGVTLSSTEGDTRDLTNIVVEDSNCRIKATVPAGVTEGIYQVFVETENCTNKISGARFEICEPIEISNASKAITAAGMFDLPDNGTVPVPLILITDNRAEVTPARDNSAQIEVSIDPGTQILLNDNMPYTGIIAPPRQVPMSEEVAAKVSPDAVIFTMGSATDNLKLGEGQTMVVKLTITLPSSAPLPSIYYLDVNENLSIAGVSGEKDGQIFNKGGTLLNTRLDTPEESYNTYTFGLLMDHMSTFVVGTKAAPDSSHIEDKGLDSESEYIDDKWWNCFINVLTQDLLFIKNYLKVNNFSESFKFVHQAGNIWEDFSNCCSRYVNCFVDTFLAPPRQSNILCPLDEDKSCQQGQQNVAKQREIIFIDSKVKGAEKLLSYLPVHTKGFLLDGQDDGLRQILDVLSKNPGIKALHLVSHGREGQIQLGNHWLSKSCLKQYAREFELIGDALTEGGDLLLYGCEIAKGEGGKDFLSLMANLTKADLAASDDFTGHHRLDGDWDLEIKRGHIEANVPWQKKTLEGYNYLLATIGIYDLSNSDGTTTTLAPSNVAANISFSNLTRGPDIQTTIYYLDAANVFGGAYWSCTGKDPDAYIQFSITPNTDYEITLSQLSFTLFTEDSVYDYDVGGPRKWDVEYSLNGFSSAGTKVGNTINTTYAGTAASGSNFFQANVSIALSSIVTQTGTVSFRIYGYDSACIVYDDGFAGLSAAPAGQSHPDHEQSFLAPSGTDFVVQGTVSVAITNNDPTITSNGGGATASIPVEENQTSVTTVTATDPDAVTTLTYSLIGGADQSDFSINSSSGLLTFQAAPNYEAPADDNTDNDYVVEVQVSDGDGGTDTQTITVTVTNVNESPSFSWLDAAPNYIENGPAVALDSDATISDPELDEANNYSGAALTLTRNGGASADDLFSNTGDLGALTEGQSFTLNTTTVGTVTTNSSGTLVLTLNSNATTAPMDEVLQSIAYSNNSDPPPSSVRINYSFNDNNTGSQGTGSPESTTGSITVSILVPTWDGTSDWTSGGNWNTGSAPTASMNAIINSGTVSLDSNKTINKLTLENGTTVIVQNNATLTVNGIFTNKGGAFDIQSGSSVILNSDVYNGSGQKKLTVDGSLELRSNIEVP